MGTHHSLLLKFCFIQSDDNSDSDCLDSAAATFGKHILGLLFLRGVGSLYDQLDQHDDCDVLLHIAFGGILLPFRQGEHNRNLHSDYCF